MILIFFFSSISFSYIYYEITDCQYTITYKGSGILTQSLGEYAQGKKKIIIKEGITEISSYAFSQTSFQSSALTSFIYEEVELPCSLVTIGKYAFQNYYSELRRIHFPDYPYSSYSEYQLESYYSLREIGSYAFNQNFKLICHNIPPTFTQLDSYAFSSCSIKHIGINSRITIIPSYAFHNSSLQSIKIHCLVTKIEAGSFYNCTSLKSILFDNILEITICSSIFYNCTSLEQVIFPPNVIFENANNIFYNCISLKSVTLPKLLRGSNPSLPTSMFRNCISLKYCTLPENIITIPSSMFQNTSIEKIYIPETIHNINSYSFANCLKLKYIEVNSTANVRVDFDDYSFKNTPNVNMMVIRGKGTYYFRTSSLTGSVLCILDPYYNNQYSYFYDAFEKSTVVYSTQEYADHNTYFLNKYKVNLIYGNVCEIPRQTPYPVVPGDNYDYFPWSKDCSNYFGVPSCGGDDYEVNYPSQNYDSSSNYRTKTKTYSYTYTISNTKRQPTTNPIYIDKGEDDSGKKKKGLSGGAIAGIVIACVVVVLVIICAIPACCFASFYKKQVSNSDSDSGGPETEP